MKPSKNKIRIRAVLSLIFGFIVFASLINSSIHLVTSVVARKLPMLASSLHTKVSRVNFEKTSYFPPATAIWAGVSFLVEAKEDTALLKKDLPLSVSIRQISIKPKNIFLTKWLVDMERIVIHPNNEDSPISIEQAFDMDFTRDGTIHLFDLKIPFSLDLLDLESSLKKIGREVFDLVNTGETALTTISRGETFYELNGRTKTITIFTETIDSGKWAFSLEKSDIWELNPLFDNQLSDDKVKKLSSDPFNFPTKIKLLHATHNYTTHN
jgi:hypothetical protein